MRNIATPATTSGSQPPWVIFSPFAARKARSTSRKTPASAPALAGDHFQILRAAIQNKIDVAVIVSAMAMPYAAASALEDLKIATSRMQEIANNQFTKGR